MRTSVTDPFSPGSDTVPEIWAGRTTQRSDWRDVVRPRKLAGLPERGRTILGEPGLGKSSLVGRIAADAEELGDWVTAQLRMPIGTDPLKKVAAALLDLADRAGLAAAREKRLAGVLDRVRQVAASGISLTLDRSAGPEPFTVLTDLLVALGRAAREQGRCLVVRIDEVQNVTDANALSQLLVALGDAITFEEEVVLPGGARARRSLPVAVYLTGLPEFADHAGARQGATFTRRFGTTTLSALEDDDLTAALQDFVLEGWEVPDGEGGVTRVFMEREAVAAVVDLCRGEPFLFQLAGSQAWRAGTGPVITRTEVLTGWRGARREAADHVERILERLPDRERELLEAMARLAPGDRTPGKVAVEAGFASSAQIGTTARRLDTVRGIVDRGPLYAFRHRALEAYLTSTWPDVD